MQRDIDHRDILGTRIDATTYAGATARITRWAQQASSRYVCVTNVHAVMEARELKQVWAESDLNVPDGMPLVWALRSMGVPDAERVYGPDLTLHVVADAARKGLPIALYGGTDERLTVLRATLERRFPGLEVPCSIAPPFRPLSDEEDREYTERIAGSGARIVLVGIGCPRQEQWMHAHRGRIPAVMVGVGAAFDFLIGLKPQAPRWMQRAGLEWSFRLLTEPGRLWRRYAATIPPFIALFAKQRIAHHAARLAEYEQGGGGHPAPNL